MVELSSFSEFLPYFALGVLVGVAITLGLGAIKLLRWRRTAADLESALRSHSFELQITLEELAEKNHQLQQQTELDALSGIYNRAYFDRQLRAEMKRSRREQRPLALVLLDIDHFKKINDQYGHVTGDQVIKKVARLMQQQLKRPADKLCRYGGEEFALILPNTFTDGAAALAENIRLQLAADKQQPLVTISAGCFAAIPDPASESDEFINFADKALYQAKAAGRNQVHVYPHGLMNPQPAPEGELNEH
ncbi:GGDEF domain-containing protein [Rheinheimera maricola]|uniref:diguanylate cyclase n=1 Tax=Rheinheimera maricola TaxID=2793282 RepID=A0ABS7XEU9_9GAMM|nr:GGDEF domain-containing protein [Rheinheimera maricola]MBZ9613664.1 GGDEF domain-containing protein [Rheinheimera maricola]